MVTGVVGPIRIAAVCVATGALLGLVVGGVLNRLAMFLLIRLNPGARGMTSDDGFTMGQFTVSGSLGLLAIGTVFGIIGGVIYFVLRGLMIGPRWFQVLSIAGGAAVVAGSGLVHSDGVDFRLLHPTWLAISLFIAIPGMYAAFLTVLAERWVQRRPHRDAAILWIPRAALTLLFLATGSSLVQDIAELT